MAANRNSSRRIRLYRAVAALCLAAAVFVAGPGCSSGGDVPAAQSQLPKRPSAAAAGGGVSIEPPVIRVNSRRITVEDVLRGMLPELAMLPPGLSEDLFGEQAARLASEETHRLIVQAALYQEASARQSDEQKAETDREMEDFLAEMVARAGGSRKRLDDELKQEGTSLADILQDHREQFTNQMYLKRKLLPSVVITRDTLLDYYHRNPSEFESPKKVRMRILSAPAAAFLPEGLAQPSESDMRAAKAKAAEHIEKARAAITAGEDFDKVFKEMSKQSSGPQDGLWPLMPAGSFREVEIERAAFELAEGQVSGPVATASGSYLVQALKVQPGSKTSFQQAQGRIEDKLVRQKYQKLTENYYVKLMTEAVIIEPEGFARRVIDAAAGARRPASSMPAQK